MQLHEADAGSRNPYSLAWGITAGLWWLLYTFEEPHETGAAGFIQLVHTGICQHLGKHLAYLILQDQVDAVAVQLRMAGQDLLCPCGVLLQAFVPLEKLDAFKAEMEAILGAGKCHILSIRPEGGAVL